MGQTNTLWFSQRRKLEKLFAAWAQENGVAQTPLSMVGWLMIKDLLDVDAALELIETGEV